MTSSEPPPAPPAIRTAPRARRRRPRVSRRERTALLLGPILTVGVFWAVVCLLASRERADEALAAGAIFLTVVGPSVIFGPAVTGTHVFSHLSTWDLVGVTTFFSCATAFFYSFNLDLLERLPRVGPRLRRTRRSMRSTLARKPWIRRWALAGVAFFVILPMPGSGTLVGSMVGRLIGLSPLGSFLAVAAGGTVVCVAYGWFGDAWMRFAEAHRLGVPVTVAGSLAFLALMALLGRRLARDARGASAPPHRPGS